MAITARNTKATVAVSALGLPGRALRRQEATEPGATEITRIPQDWQQNGVLASANSWQLTPVPEGRQVRQPGRSSAACPEPTRVFRSPLLVLSRALAMAIRPPFPFGQSLQPQDAQASV